MSVLSGGTERWGICFVPHNSTGPWIISGEISHGVNSNNCHATRPLRLYDYQPSWGGYHAEEFLKGFSGYLTCDGFGGYNKLKDVPLRLPCPHETVLA